VTDVERRIASFGRERWERSGSPPLVQLLYDAPGELAALAVRLRGALPAALAAQWSRRVARARRQWTRDFDGEQFALGRAFYTHFETERAGQYFADAAASDARVERVVPGMQRWARELFASLSGGIARPRYGFCGAGVHVFPAGQKVATGGGVVHHDVEGLTPLDLARRHRALSLIVMLQRPEHGGGLRVHDAEYQGSDSASDADLASAHRTLRYEDGDALLMSSYRLHQIRPFRGARDRVSLTLHGVEVDRAVWDTWF
jgi:hypothetical protein